MVDGSHEQDDYHIRVIIATTKFVGPYCYVYIVGTSCFAVWTLKELGERKKSKCSMERNTLQDSHFTPISNIYLNKIETASNI